MFFTESQVQLIIISTCVVFFIIVCIKPLRDLAIWIINKLLIPAIFWLANYIILYSLKKFKDVLVSHKEILKNLYTSRAIIFLNLEDQRQDRDKKMNRKTQ
ncbi:hypothetical protein HLH17_16365 [Acinetobacter sp. ANC 5380]|uniref:Uncharacterized protein n=1 Tax=Acinetobacter terrae TaxID=2731247 RepID=A0A7Y2WC98_9GAMM|nr:hypothetical protein [Acinetobacter terrae]NNH79192.1 hypothetical protein [Acinetobacter terrae]